MSQLTYSTCAAVNSILACANCAKSKSKCDRKIPCSRCRMKKLTCQTRVPLRGKGRSPSSKNPKLPKSTNTNRSVDIVESNSDTGIFDEGLDAIPQNYSTENGLYMNWSHSAIHRWPRSQLRDVSEAEKLAYFSRALTTAPEINKGDLSNFSLSSYSVSGVLKAADDFDFGFPTQIVSPAAQFTDFSETPWTPSWNFLFSVPGHADEVNK